MMEGFDFWRKAMKSVRSRSEIRRHELLAPIQQPPTVNKHAEVPLAPDKWDGILREHFEAGGRPLTFEEKRAALLRLLLSKFRENVFSRISALHESYFDLPADDQDFAYRTFRAQLQRQVEMTVQWANIGSLPVGSQANIFPEGNTEQQGGEQPGQDDPAYAAWKGKGKGYKGKGKGKGKDMKACTI